MYVLVVENQNRRNSGYLLINDEREYQTINGVEYISVDSEDYYIYGIEEAKHLLEGETEPMLLPFGEIATHKYNARADKYIEDGGTVEHLLRKSKKFVLDPPHPPIWFFGDFEPSAKSEAEESDTNKATLLNALSEFEPQQVRYIRAASVELAGDYYTLFDVETLSELFDYDLQRVRSLQIPVEVCKYCGHAFVKTSRDVMCNKCRKEKKGEAEKHRRWNESEINREYAKFTNALRKRNGVGTASAYYCWITEKRDAGTVTVEWLEKWKKIDKGYQKLCRHFKRAEEATEQIDYAEEWNKSYSDFPHNITDPEKWVNEWLDKIK